MYDSSGLCVCVAGVLALTFISLTDAQSCPGGWVPWLDRGTCYYKASSADVKSRGDAATACASLNSQATLLTLADQAEWDYVRNNVIGLDRVDYWIGLYHIGPVTYNSKTDKNRWFWQGSTVYSWQNWHNGANPEPSGEDQCVRLFPNGYWGDAFCISGFRYICKLNIPGAVTQYNSQQPSVAPSVAHSVAHSVAPALSSYLPSQFVSQVSQVVTGAPPVSVVSVFGNQAPSVVPSVVPQSNVPVISKQPTVGPTISKLMTVTTKRTTRRNVTPPKTTTKRTTTKRPTTTTRRTTTTTPKPTTTTNKQNVVAAKTDDALNKPLVIGVAVAAGVVMIATIVIGVVILVRRRRKNGDDNSSEGATNSAFHVGERPSVRGREPERLPTWLEEKEEDSPPPPTPFSGGLDDTDRPSSVRRPQRSNSRVSAMVDRINRTSAYSDLDSVAGEEGFPTDSIFQSLSDGHAI